jgi:hypothetical protein
MTKMFRVLDGCEIVMNVQAGDYHTYLIHLKSGSYERWYKGPGSSGWSLHGKYPLEKLSIAMEDFIYTVDNILKDRLIELDREQMLGDIVFSDEDFRMNEADRLYDLKRDNES